MGHLAIVAHSKILKALIPIDNLFFQTNNKGKLEWYFDVTKMGKAMAFVQAN